MTTAQTDEGITPREVGEWHGDRLEYGRIPLAVTTDLRIGADAFRLWSYMATVLTRHVDANPSGRWDLTKADCCRACGLTEHRWSKATAELTTAGLYRGKAVRAKAGTCGWNRNHTRIVPIGGTMLFEHHLFLPDAGGATPTTPKKIRGGRIKGDSTTSGQAPTLTREILATEIETETHTPARARKECVHANPNLAEAAEKTDRFGEFWGGYPKHSGERAARREWDRKGLDAMADTLIADVRNRRARDRKWRAGYAPGASTYLRDERWHDEVEPERQTQREEDIHFRLAE